jgi:hypothetical protein
MTFHKLRTQLYRKYYLVDRVTEPQYVTSIKSNDVAPESSKNTDSTYTKFCSVLLNNLMLIW